MRLIKGVLLNLILLTSPFVFGQDTKHEPGSYAFIENGGQWPANVHCKANMSGGKVWLEKKGVLYQLLDLSEVHGHHAHQEGEVEVLEEAIEIPQHLIFAEFVGCNEDALIEKNEPTSEYYNFYIGNDEDRWAEKMFGYHEVIYNELYSGIDLVFYEKKFELKYEYVIQAGADPADILVNYLGYDKISLAKNGNLEIKTSLGKIIEQKPFSYQVKNGKIIEVESAFKLSKDGHVSFDLGNYDKSLELVIDPVLIFATYAGSVTDNFGMTATYAYDGKAYSGGTIYGNAYPTPGPAYNTLSNFTQVHGPTYGITDAFISKYNADGTAMLWTTFVGGGDNNQGTETAHSLICDTSNNIYVYGATSSTDFPIQNGFQSMHGGGVAGSNYLYNGVYYTDQGTDIYIAKFSEDGTTLMGSSYVGGDANDGVNYRLGGGTYNSIASYDSLTSNYGDQFRGEIMLDSMNNIYIASCTRSTNFPTANAFQGALGGQQDGVIFKVSSDFSTLLWSSYFGGTSNDACYSVKIDSSYNVLVSGGTSSPNLLNTIGGLNPAYLGGKTDGFVTKITPDGTTVTQTTYIGTSSSDQAIFVEIDRWDNVYLVGNSDGLIPVVNAPYSNPNSGQFIMKLTPDLTTIDYSTVFGNGSGQPNISPAAFLVDVCGNVYVSGWGGNILGGAPISGMPVTTDAFQSTPPDGYDFYLFVLERDAQDILYGSYLGDPNADEHVDGGTSRFDKFGVVYQSVCGGCTGKSGFPTTSGAHSEVNLNVDPDGAGPLSYNGGGCNNLIFKFDFELIPDADFQLSSLEGCAPFTLTLDNESNDTVNSVWTFPPEATVISGGVNPELLFNDPGTYEIIISITDTICNLIDTAKKVVTVYEELQLDILYVNDTVVCAPYTQDLIADSQGSAISFTWSDDPTFTNVLNSGAMDSVITISPTTSTTYYVMATNGWTDCDLIDSVVVQFVDGGAELIGVDSMCLGDTIVLEAHNLIPSIDMDYSWSPSLGQVLVLPGDSIALVSPPTSMWYCLTAVTNLGCTIYDSIFINVSYIDPADVMAIAVPDTIPEGGTSVLTAYPAGYNYIWYPQGPLDSPTGQSVTATLDETTTFQVFISGNGCEAKTPVTVYTREFICGDIYIFVPSAFTPNGDNENDVLYVRGENLLEIDLKIFDRWGELMFETTDQGIGWDGTYKGEPVDPDVYVYHLTAICFDGQESLIKGNITVLK